MIEALRLCCQKGCPVCVFRSHREKRSSYAPKLGVRYDGEYRIEKCWCKIGKQVCFFFLIIIRCNLFN
ncbi:putative PUA-like domain, oxidoreductase-like protein [Medicago truncatula]|uniref:Putative PUA-like domain, oxidoreductase-like protein n=1 Tax=Medicago truncatula TaxID=3880 RepID=A0A396HIA9_MEDTR|nr:putative PUA-like domain, oxidoreductase-like protein [Medicago truncatula]